MQGALQARYAAYQHPVLGALLLSGLHEVCGANGAARLPEGRLHINGCYAVNEPGASTIESSIGVFTEVCTINTTGRPGSWKVLGARLQRSGHRSDDKSVEDAIEKCFGLMRKH